MNKKSNWISFLALGLTLMGCSPASSGKAPTIISPAYEAITQTVTTTGIVTPRNRLQIQPPVAGRLEQMLVKEGQLVKAGAPLAVMSSTDRATLMDAARGQGDKEWKYWQDVYKPIQLVAPMDATVIVATLQPGQVVATTDPIVVLSDELIVQAQVDETDISKIKPGQDASVTLDSFPDDPFDAQVEHIYYESVVSSNVTVYKVDLKVLDTPDFLRSGMNAQVAFDVESKEKALVLPAESINLSSGHPTVTILDDEGKQQSVSVETGITTDKLVEVVSGLTPDSKVVVKSKKLNLGKAEGKNPFMPQLRPNKPAAGATPQK